MQDAEGEEGGQQAGEDLAVAAVELGDGGQGEGQGHVLGKVDVGAGAQVQRVAVVLLGRLGRALAQVLLVVEAVAHHAQAQEGEVGREGGGKGSRDGCRGGKLLVSSCRKQKGLKHVDMSEGPSLTKQRCEHRVVETDLGRHFDVYRLA